MTDETARRALKEYFTACFLAVTSSLFGLVGSDDGTGGGLWLIAVAALGMAIMMYVQTRPKEGPKENPKENNNDSEIAVPLPRLKKMAVLWYALSIALGVPFVKDVLLEMDTASQKQWILSVVGLCVCLFALFRIIVVLTKKTEVRDHGRRTHNPRP